MFTSIRGEAVSGLEEGVVEEGGRGGYNMERRVGSYWEEKTKIGAGRTRLVRVGTDWGG